MILYQHTLLQFVLQGLQHLALSLVALGLSWIGLALFDFGYSLWFSLLNIGPFIDQVAPLNHFKHGFDQLSRDEYFLLFHQINSAIHLEPEALHSITYHYQQPTGESISAKLLRAPEITHLNDVARMIQFFLKSCLIAGIALIGWQRLGPKNTMSKKAITRTLGIFWVCLMSLAVIIFATQPVQFFYWLHEVVFPAQNQWFFYYQESLMTTLMKAPDLFGPIAIALLICWISLHWILTFLLLGYGRRGKVLGKN